MSSPTSSFCFATYAWNWALNSLWAAMVKVVYCCFDFFVVVAVSLIWYATCRASQAPILVIPKSGLYKMIVGSHADRPHTILNFKGLLSINFSTRATTMFWHSRQNLATWRSLSLVSFSSFFAAKLMSILLLSIKFSDNFTSIVNNREPENTFCTFSNFIS